MVQIEINEKIANIEVKPINTTVITSDKNISVSIENNETLIDVLPQNVNVEAIENTIEIDVKTKVVNVDVFNYVPSHVIPELETGRVRISAQDVSSDYVESKILHGAGIEIIKDEFGGNETIKIGLYTEPQVSLSGGGTYEIGFVLPDVFLAWTVNKPMLVRDLSAPVPSEDRERGPGGSGFYDHIGANISTNTTYSITVADGRIARSANTVIQFRYKRYFGTSEKEELTSSDLLQLNGELATNRLKSWSQNGNGQYIYYAYPSSWGGAQFYANGLLNTAWVFNQISHTNAQGVTEMYNVYRSINIQNGDNILLEVK